MPTAMSNGNQSSDQTQRIPPPGTMAYAQWKRHQELLSKEPENQKTGKEVSQMVGQETRQEAVQPEEKPDTKPTLQPASKPSVETASTQLVVPVSILAKKLKPLGAEEPTKKATFLVTTDEAEILEELKLHLRRRFKVKAKKNDIVRAAIRLIGQDFLKNQQTSFLARKLVGK